MSHACIWCLLNQPNLDETRLSLGGLTQLNLFEWKQQNLFGWEVNFDWDQRCSGWDSCGRRRVVSLRIQSRGPRGQSRDSHYP